MLKDKLVSIDELRLVIFSSLEFDEVRSNKLYDRILFDYGYYGDGMTIKRIKGCIYNYNHICSFGNSYTDDYFERKFQEGPNYKYRIKNEEINQILKILRK